MWSNVDCWNIINTCSKDQCGLLKSCSRFLTPGSNCSTPGCPWPCCWPWPLTSGTLKAPPPCDKLLNTGRGCTCWGVMLAAAGSNIWGATGWKTLEELVNLDSWADVGGRRWDEEAIISSRRFCCCSCCCWRSRINCCCNASSWLHPATKILKYQFNKIYNHFKRLTIHNILKGKGLIEILLSCFGLMPMTAHAW